jgi:hypothetical protein
MIVFYCLAFETPPTWRVRSPFSYHPGRGWPSYTLLVVSYDLQGYGGSIQPRLQKGHPATQVKAKVKVILHLAVYRQSFCLGVKPLETHDQIFFSTEPLR